MLHAKFQDHRTSGSGEDFWLAAKAASMYSSHLVIPSVYFRR